MNLNQLNTYIPPNSSSFIEKWLKDYALTLVITKNRKTKLGDYRKIRDHQRHQITINGDLNPMAFFFVLTHEIAHLMIYDQYQFGQVAPHGVEWKTVFGTLLLESLEVYPSNLQPYIAHHARKPKASVGADLNIARFLIDDCPKNQVYLEDLNSGDIFELNQKCFKKGTKRKSRYLCVDLSTQRNYLIHATAFVNKREPYEK